MTSSKNQVGFTLIEVLVTLLVVAIGLLGLANLQTIGLRNNHSTNLMSQAIWLANDIIDRARSNVGKQNNYYNDNYNDKNSYQCSAHSEDPSPSPDCYHTSCNTKEMTAYDLSDWRQTVCKKLPNASITVCIDSNPSDSHDCLDNSAIKGITPYMIKLEWDDPAQQDEQQLQSDQPPLQQGRQALIMTFQVTRMPDKPEDNLNKYKKLSN